MVEYNIGNASASGVRARARRELVVGKGKCAEKGAACIYNVRCRCVVVGKVITAEHAINKKGG